MTQSFPRAIPVSVKNISRVNPKIPELNLAKPTRLRHTEVVLLIESENVDHDPPAIRRSRNFLEKVELSMASDQDVAMIKLPVELRRSTVPRIPSKKERVTKFCDSYDSRLGFYLSIEID